MFRRRQSEAIALLRKFPKLDMEALKAQYPDIENIEKLKKNKKTLGCHEWNTA